MSGAGAFGEDRDDQWTREPGQRPTSRRPRPPRPFDEHNYRRSLQELKLFKREYPDAIVTPGHDPEFYAGLSARYE